MSYDTQESRESAKIKLQELREQYPDAPVENWFHLGSDEGCQFLELKSLHDEKNLIHVGFGDFKSPDGKFEYVRMADTDAGRLYLKRPILAMAS